ncbi:hypothetical protein GCM10007231_00120 [Nocardioides daphniae]|uniref:Polysaccharide chain length determinant N-terminal domain-containing protein n=1 Tax=Nocardioides daphniae TaxID=402297 RepID=A0ABQ1PW38_9ACTN|nr:hypothetical protein GCM10007231_00120 [Nocardioides daphniae]
MDLSYYGQVIRRRWKLAVLGLLVGILAAVALLQVQPQRATSSVSVNVNPITDNAFSSSRPASDLLVPETEQAMARSTTVVRNVAELSDGDLTAAQVRANMVATLLPDSTVVRIDYTASTPRESADGAVLVAKEYLTYRSAVAEERIDQAVQQLEKRRKPLEASLVDANRAVSAAQTGADRAAAEARLQSVTADLTSVNSQINQLRAISTSGGTIISEPDPQRAVVSPDRAAILVAGVLGGLLLGLVLPFMGNAFDRRVRSAHDVARAGGGGVVATLDQPRAVVPPGDEDADEIRALRERLLAVVVAERPVLVVADVGPADHLPSDVATNLAVLIADSGKATTLLLPNYPDESLAQVVSALGLVEGRYAQGARWFHSRVVASLVVAVPAPDTDRVSAADIVAGLLQDTARRSAVTVVGLAPGSHSIRLTAARLAHQVVLSVAKMSTRAEDLNGVVTELGAVGAPVHGSVLVHSKRVLSADVSLLRTPTSDVVPVAAAQPAEEVPEVATEGATDPGHEQHRAPGAHADEGGHFNPFTSWFARGDHAEHGEHKETSAPVEVESDVASNHVASHDSPVAEAAESEPVQREAVEDEAAEDDAVESEAAEAVDAGAETDGAAADEGEVEQDQESEADGPVDEELVDEELVDEDPSEADPSAAGVADDGPSPDWFGPPSAVGPGGRPLRGDHP